MSPLFASRGQSIGVSASTSVLPVNTQNWSPLGWTGWISLQSKGLSNAVVGCNLKNNRMISVLFQGKPFIITVIQACASATNAKEAEVELFCEDLQDLLELTPKNRCPFHNMALECKSRESRETWSNRQVWPWSTKWSRANANRVLPSNRLVVANTLFQKHKRRLYTWTSPDGQYQNQIDCILCSQRWRRCIQSAKPRPGADCGSDHEHLIAKFRLKLKKVGKTSRPFRYDLNQISYDIQWKWEIDLRG